MNGTTAFSITPPSNSTQYLAIQNDKSLQQSLVTQLGYYALSFNYVGRPGYTFNNMKIYLNGTLYDTVTTIPTNWSLYSNPNLSSILGTNTILLLGTATQNEGDIALTNIKVFYGQTGGAGVATTVTYNTNSSIAAPSNLRSDIVIIPSTSTPNWSSYFIFDIDVDF